MSARDSESGSSTYKGGSGRAGGLGNGGIGGGMGGGGNYGGGMGGGAGRMGGLGSRTGLTTGTQMYGGMAFGRPGGNAMNPGAWGIRERSPITQGPLNRPTRPGLLGNPTPTAVPGVNPVPEYVPQLPDMYYPPMENPLVDVQPGLPRLDQMPVPGVPEWTPAAPYDPAFQSIPVTRTSSAASWAAIGRTTVAAGRRRAYPARAAAALPMAATQALIRVARIPRGCADAQQPENRHEPARPAG